ncbi:MAG: hypothetical protein MAG453_00886 [Calditrichaeota bacterium]|nr:hypothetical protein [Calditrichota bacterium]
MQSRTRMMLAAAVAVAIAVTFAGGFAQTGDPDPTEHKQMMIAGEKVGQWVFTADTLYHCPEHRMAVTAKAGRTCPAEGCDAELVMMSEEEVKAFRAKELEACSMPMCSFAIATEVEGVDDCPYCKMGLKPVDHPEKMKHSEEMEQSKEMKEHDADGSHAH